MSDAVSSATTDIARPFRGRRTHTHPAAARSTSEDIPTINSFILLFSIAVGFIPASALAQETEALQAISGAGETIVIPNFRDPRALAERPAQPPEKIEFLASDDFPPFSFRDPQGRLTGFNVDLARAVCEELGASCSLRVKAFEALPDALMAGEGDAILSALPRRSPCGGDGLFRHLHALARPVCVGAGHGQL
ncbi:transporter substrate-binding domain-containing protein [Pannonibacter sp. Pt2-lr]